MVRKNNSIDISPKGALETATIESLSHDGRGVARVQGKITFIQGALPYEVVTFQTTRKKKDFNEARLVEVVTPSADRVEPRCPHYAMCGGCSLQHLASDAQIRMKESQLIDNLARIGHVVSDDVLPPLTSAVWHYRNKARLSVRYVQKKETTLIGFRERNNPRYITEISSCPVLHAQVDSALPDLRRLVDSLSDPHQIAQIEVAAGDDDVALIFRNLTPLTERDLAALTEFGEAMGFRIYLQPGGPDTVHPIEAARDKPPLQYTLPAEDITYHFQPTDFTQVNAPLNRLMVAEALELLDLKPEDRVLDLFCGLGNFSLPIAKHCQSVLGVEGSAAMVGRAGANATLNGITTVAFKTANLEDEQEVKNTLKLAVTHHQVNKLLLDPPRTGAATIAQSINTLAPERIVYVSCNPATLARDAGTLVQAGYQLVKTGVMDMFPHTAHVESIALFIKR